MADALERLVLHWSPQRPLAAVRWAGWGVVAEPAATYRLDPDGTAIWIANGAPASPPVALTGRPLDDLRRLLEWGQAESRGSGHAGWIGCFSYDLGRVLEPAVERGGAHAAWDRRWPLIELHWCPAAVVAEPGGAESPARFSVGRFSSRTGRAAFEGAASRVIEYIRAGDVFQVNLAHRLSAPFAGRTRDLFLSMCEAADPWHGAYLEGAALAGEDRRALVSASPELFLQVEGSRVTTRPMKGTRPADADPRELQESAKDRAELNMIIDLMRNDLGRIARVGSVRVAMPRNIERHGGERGVWQATATVEATLTEGAGVPELLAAAFPPGSVTGAPKIRAMQIIDELEPVRRGPYCGSIGWIGADGTARLSVAIRTALVQGRASRAASLDDIAEGTIDYSVGAGIVADSEPAAEWRETLDKAGILTALRQPEGLIASSRGWSRAQPATPPVAVPRIHAP